MSYQPTPDSREHYPEQALVESGTRVARVIYLLQGRNLYRRDQLYRRRGGGLSQA